jgi:hypothetical protein
MLGCDDGDKVGWLDRVIEDGYACYLIRVPKLVTA